MEKKAIDLSFLDPRGAWGALKTVASKGRGALPAPIRSVWDTAQGWNPLYRELTGAPAYIDHTKDPVFKYDTRKNWDDLQEWANSKGWVPGVANAVVTSMPRAMNIAIDRALTDRHKTDPNVSLGSDLFDVAMAWPGGGAAKTSAQAAAGISRAAIRNATKAMAKPGVNGLGHNALAAAGGAAKGVAEATRRYAGNWFTGLGHAPWARTLAAADDVIGKAAMSQYFLHNYEAPGLPELWTIPNLAKPWIGGPDYYDTWTGLHMYNPFGLLNAGLTGKFKPFLRNWGTNQVLGAGVMGGVDAARYLPGTVTDPYAGYGFLLRSDGPYATDPNAPTSLTKLDVTPNGSLSPGLGGQAALTLLNYAINENEWLNDRVKRNFGLPTREGDAFIEALKASDSPQYMLFTDPYSDQRELTPAAKALLQDPHWRDKLLDLIKEKTQSR